MPYARGPVMDDAMGDRSPEGRSPASKRRKAVGDIDFGDDAEIDVDESVSVVDMLLSLGFSDQAARKTVAE
eukprot:8154429-Heterocapsa_arctica.AAC.1